MPSTSVLPGNRLRASSRAAPNAKGSAPATATNAIFKLRRSAWLSVAVSKGPLSKGGKTESMENRTGLRPPQKAKICLNLRRCRSLYDREGVDDGGMRGCRKHAHNFDLWADPGVGDIDNSERSLPPLDEGESPAHVLGAGQPWLKPGPHAQIRQSLLRIDAGGNVIGI